MIYPKATATITPELINESLNSTDHYGDSTDNASTGITNSNIKKTSTSARTATATPTAVNRPAAVVSTTEISNGQPSCSCDACPHCQDVCCANYEKDCRKCSTKMAHFRRSSLYYCQQQQRQQQRNSFPFFQSFTKPPKRRIHHLNHYQHHSHNFNKSSNNNKNTNENKEYISMTPCQMKRYNNKQDGIYIQCNNEKIYDVTNYIDHHPGGINSILRKAGGVVDCTRDLNFHSSKAKTLWEKFHIGYLVPCPGEGCHANRNGFEVDDLDMGVTVDVNVKVDIDIDGDSPMDGGNGDILYQSTQQDQEYCNRQLEFLDRSKQCVIS